MKSNKKTLKQNDQVIARNMRFNTEEHEVMHRTILTGNIK